LLVCYLVAGIEIGVSLPLPFSFQRLVRTTGVPKYKMAGAQDLCMADSR
jgi:hypothetical protein